MTSETDQTEENEGRRTSETEPEAGGEAGAPLGAANDEPGAAAAAPQETTVARRRRWMLSRRLMIIGGGIAGLALLFGSGFAAGAWLDHGGHQPDRTPRIERRGDFHGRELPGNARRFDSQALPLPRGNSR